MMKTVMINTVLILALCGPCCGFSRVNEIPTPGGYQRIHYSPGSYRDYLRHLPLKKENTIYRWDGKTAWAILYRVYAVVDKPLLFKSDLEQCADFCMRFWADFHRDRGNLDNLYLFDYHGAKKYFSKSGKKYSAYLKWHMAFSNSYSIKKGARKVDSGRLKPGDMFVQNSDGGIGHVSLIVDAAADGHDNRLYLIGYGFIPAQEFHIEKAKYGYGKDGWFTKDGYLKYLSEFPFKRYGAPVLRRFD